MSRLRYLLFVKLLMNQSVYYCVIGVWREHERSTWDQITKLLIYNEECTNKCYNQSCFEGNGYVTSFDSFENEFHKKALLFFSYYYKQKTIYLILEKRCCFITDMCIKSYHNQLKSYHFSRTRNIRVNRSVIFFHELYYWLSIRCCARSIWHKKNVSREEKKKADSIDIDE